MEIIKIHNNFVLPYNPDLSEKYWTKLSLHIEEKYGLHPITEHSKVEEVLLESLSFLTSEFRALVQSETTLAFYLHTFWLHEQSIKLYVLTLSGASVHPLTETEFAVYRRTLKLILEQGCDFDFSWGSEPDKSEYLRMNNVIQELTYLGTWMYEFADHIAFQKMIDECHRIDFDENKQLTVHWQYHYGYAYQQLFPQLHVDYKGGTFDENAMTDLKAALEKCFGIDYNVAGAQIFEIKKHHNPANPERQTIQPHVLPLNLIAVCNTTEENANFFYEGLTISRSNKLPIEKVIYNPYSTDRYFFRPILIYKIDGEDRALIGIEKYSESMMVIATNAIHWNAMPKEWLKNRGMKEFMHSKGNDHDKILEDQIETIVKKEGLIYDRNIKSLKQRTHDNLNIDNETVGEIDFIIADTKLKVLHVTDSKYNRARYEAVGFRADNSNFINLYEPQLLKKITWASANLKLIQTHLEIVSGSTDLDLTGYSVKGAFFINTPSFYMFNGVYPAITLNSLPDYLKGKVIYPELVITGSEEDDFEFMMVNHPYFKKPIIFNPDQNDSTGNDNDFKNESSKKTHFFHLKVLIIVALLALLLFFLLLNLA